MASWEELANQARIEHVCWALFAPTCVIVILRLICRAISLPGKLGSLGLDDYITVACLVIYLLSCIFITIAASYGLGKHIDTLTQYEVSQAIKWNAIASFVLIWTFSLPKFAIIAILKRILNYGRKTAILFWTLGLTSQASILATSIYWVTMCQPVAYQWDKSIKGGKCGPPEIMMQLGYATSIYSAFLDLFFAFYPIPFVMRLNMPLKNRIAVCIALSLSALAFTVSVYKIAIFRSVFAMLGTDPTYAIPYIDILGFAEGTILIICASLPTLGPLFRAVKGQITSHVSSPSVPHKSIDESQGQLGSSCSNGWPDFRGHKLEDGSVTTGLHASADDIPLVSTAASVPSKY